MYHPLGKKEGSVTDERRPRDENPPLDLPTPTPTPGLRRPRTLPPSPVSRFGDRHHGVRVDTNGFRTGRVYGGEDTSEGPEGKDYGKD